MGHTFIDNARKRYSYQLLKHRPALQYSMISHRVQEQFGKRQPLIAPSTLTAIKQAGDLTGDPCYTSPVLRAGRTLTYGHKKLILDELMELCTVSTAELERKLGEVDVSGHSSRCRGTAAAGSGGRRSGAPEDQGGQRPHFQGVSGLFWGPTFRQLRVLRALWGLGLVLLLRGLFRISLLCLIPTWPQHTQLAGTGGVCLVVVRPVYVYVCIFA